jgi:hypothetical protein
LEEGRIMSRGFKLSVELGSNFRSEFAKNVTAEISKQIVKKIPRAIEAIKAKIQQIVIVKITSCPEYAAIVGSDVRGELGINEASSRMDAIINEWASNIVVTLVPENVGGLALIKIGIIQRDYADVLDLAEAEMSYVGRRGQKTLEWLRWLLLEGGSVIVSNYEYSGETRRGHSRTGLGIMIKRRGGWKVPAAIAGIESDNFVTRALSEIQDNIDIIVRQELTKVL